MKVWGNLFNGSKTTEKMNRPDEHKQETSVIDDDMEMIVVIEESERFNGSWSSDHLLPNDPMRFKSSAGQSASFPNPPLADGWDWIGIWEVEKHHDEHHDEHEWLYGFNFDDIEKGLGSLEPFNRSKGQYLVRRKRWIRTVKPSPSSTTAPITINTLQSKSFASQSSVKPSTPTKDNFIERNSLHGDESGTIEAGFDSSILPHNIAVVGADDAKFEIESDTDEFENIASVEVDESEKKGLFSSFQQNYLSSNGTTNLPAEFNIRVRDPTLVSIGKQIKSIEAECKNMDDSDNNDWQKYSKAALVIQIRELEKVCESLKENIDKEVHKGLEYITKLEDELRGYTNRLEEAKKKFYFPQSFISIGQGGVYMALDDFWLENASGHFDIELIPSKDTPEIKILLSGAKDDTAGGIIIRLRVDGFKLAGDKGKRIPKFKFDNMKVLVSLRASIFIHYDVNTSKWVVTNPKNFKVELLSFKGPYGITQSMVSAVLSVITPALRTRILTALPPELGLLMRTFPSPFSCRGEFDITGPELTVLVTPLEQSPLLCQMFEYSPSQMDMFQWLQRSMDRSKVIRTMTDLLQYVRTHVKYKDNWTALINLWNQAAKIYSEKVTTIRYDQLNNHLNHTQHQPIDPGQTTITFNSFLTVAEDFRKKRLGAYFKLHYMDGQVSLNQILRYGHQLFHRNATEESKKATGVRQARLLVMLDRIQTNYEQGLEAIKLVSKNIDFAQLKIKASLNAGPEGKLQMTVSDILAQLPLVLSFSLLKEKNLGHAPLVPYIISIKPQESGDLLVEIYHYSKEGHEGSKTGEHKTRGLGGPKKSEVAVADDHPSSTRSRTHSITSNTGSVASASETNITASASSIDVLNISGLATSSLNTFKKGVTQVTQTIHEGIHKIDEKAATLTQWSSASGITPRSSILGFKKRTTGAFGFSNAERRNQELEQTLHNMPQGDIADTILNMTVSRPHISLIADKPVTLKPGSEIFTVLIGPRDKDWVPFGSDAVPFSSTSANDTPLKNQKSQRRKSNDTTPTQDSEPGDQASKGCPILVQTSPGIKLMNQIPKAEVTINLPGLVRFIGSHFNDIDRLKSFLEKFGGGEIFEEHLNLGKLILDRFAKYLLLPGVNIDININGKLVALNNEIIISIETPDFSAIDPNTHKPTQPIMQSASSRRGSSILLQRPADKNKDKNSLCALTVHAEMNLIDIVEDSLAVEQSLKSFE